MRIACLIMAHRDPSQIERLIKKFDHPGFAFYIHLDAKIGLDDYSYLGQLENVHFIKQRTKVRWASFSFVKALLISFQEILDSGEHYDYVSVMSGQDYPIKPVEKIYSHLVEKAGSNFICFEEDGSAWWNHAISRVHKYHFTNFGFIGRYRFQFLINRILPDRKFPFPYTLYGGPRAMCMTLTRDCLIYVVNFFKENKKLRRFGLYSWGPDEFMIPTLIMNSRFKSSVVNNNFYYIDWSRGGSNPKILTVEDFEILTKSDKMLARKFDMVADAEILDLIDSYHFA
jgi:hypothetical protein